MDVGNDVVRDGAGVHQGRRRTMEVQADRVPQRRQQKPRQKHDPEAQAAVQQVAAPAPRIALQQTVDGAGDQIAAQHKEDHHALVADGAEGIDRSEQRATRARETGIVEKNEVAPVPEQHKERRQATHKI